MDISKIISWLKNYKETTNCKGVVLGLSGGKDSTTVAMLSKLVFGDNVLAVLMPNGTQSDIDDSIAIAEALGIDYRIVNIETAFNNLVFNIQTTIENISGRNEYVVNCPTVTPKALTNIPPRLRMATLYAIGQTIGYRVIGTGNASEAYIGWFTKWGDGANDFNPIANLTCSQVVELGKELAPIFGLDEKYITKTPSDGLTGKSDEDNFGFTYEQLDKYIMYGTSGDAVVDDKIKRLHEISEHKRSMPIKMD